MPRKIKATLPDGRKIKLTVPDGASNDQIKQKLEQISSSTPQFDDRSLLQKAGDFATSATEKSRELTQPLQEKLAPVGEAISPLVQSALGDAPAAAQLGFAGLQGIDIAGEKAATELAERQIVSPEAAAAIGTGIQSIPDILGGGAAFGAKRLGTSALKRAFTSKGIGAQMGAAEKAAGVREIIPTTRGLAQAAKLPVKTDFSNVRNFVQDALDNGQALPKQFLADFRIASEAALKTEVFRPSTKKGVLLLKTKKQVDILFDKAIPGRGKLSKRFAVAKKREKLLESLGGATKKAAGVAALGAIGGSLGAGAFNLFK